MLGFGILSVYMLGVFFPLSSSEPPTFPTNVYSHFPWKILPFSPPIKKGRTNWTNEQSYYLVTEKSLPFVGKSFFSTSFIKLHIFTCVRARWCVKMSSSAKYRPDRNERLRNTVSAIHLITSILIVYTYVCISSVAPAESSRLLILSSQLQTIRQLHRLLISILLRNLHYCTRNEIVSFSHRTPYLQSEILQ